MFKVSPDDTAGTRNQRRDWHDRVTLDESSFYYITEHELIWLPPDGRRPALERVRVQSKK
jgi:hypothetical protein